MRLPNFITRFGAKPDMGETAKTEAAIYKLQTTRWPAVTDDLLTKKGSCDIYREMRHEPEIKAALLVLQSAVLSRGWELHPGAEEGEEPTPQAEEQRDFIEDVFDRMPGSIDDVLEQVLKDSLVFGTAIAELNYTLIPDGDNAGKIGLASVKPKDPSIYYFELDDYSNVTGLKYQLGGAYVNVDPNKFIVFPNTPEHSKPEGTSELRSAYRWYWLKKNLTQFWAIYLEKYGMPTVKGSVPSGTSSAARQQLLDVLKTIQQETALVHTADQEIELLTGNVQATGSGFKEAVAYCDEMMVKSLLLQTLTSSEGDRVGSMALGKVHQDTLDLLITRMRRRLEELVDERIVRPLIDWNFAEPVYPNFALAIEDKDTATLTTSIKALIDCKAVDYRESWIRKYLGLPEREELPELPPEPNPFMPGQIPEEPGGAGDQPAGFHSCNHEHFATDAPAGIGKGEQPSDPRVAKAIEDYHADLAAAAESLRVDVWRILALPEVETMAAEEVPETFIYTPEQQAVLEAAVEKFLVTMAGSDRTRRGFVSPRTGDGLIQQWDMYAHQVGANIAAEKLGVAAATMPDRNAAASRRFLGQAFDRLSEGGQMRLEGILPDIQTRLAEAIATGENPISVARDLSGTFDAYKGWEFERLARTETAFAQVAGELQEYREQSVDTAEVEDDPPPWHPNCMCSTNLEQQPDGSWKAVYLVSAEACEICQAYAQGAE